MRFFLSQYLVPLCQEEGMNMYARTEALLGEEAFKKLRQLRIMVIGAGGVGSHAAQALAYMGVG